MAYYLVNSGMSIATLCFLIGYYYRLNTKVHRIYMSSGVVLVLVSALILVGSIHILFDGNRIAAGFVNVAPGYILLSHRILAIVCVALMLMMVKTGIKKERTKHIRYSNYFIVTYLIVYTSGLFIFESA